MTNNQTAGEELMLCRQAFEEWHDSLFDISAKWAAWSGYGYPRDSYIQARWQAYQAAWNSRSYSVDLHNGKLTEGAARANEADLEMIKQIDAARQSAPPLAGAAKVSQEWQPIETAPKDGSMFLVCLPRMMNLIVRATYNTVHKYFVDEVDNDGAVSRPAFYHKGDVWMPLPNPPATKRYENQTKEIL